MNNSTNYAKSYILLNEVVANTESNSIEDGIPSRGYLFSIKATDVTTGATVAFEHLDALGNWIELHRVAVTTDTSQSFLLYPVYLLAVRAVVSDYTDGKYSATVNTTA